jgi:hypothetical protein
MNGFPFSEEYKSLFTNASREEVLLLHDPFEVERTKPTTMGDLFFWCRTAFGFPPKGDKFAALQAAFQKERCHLLCPTGEGEGLAPCKSASQSRHDRGNAEAPILMLAASYAATRRPPGGGLALEVARDALVSFGSQREVVEVAEPAAATYPATFDLSESFSILAASLNAEHVQGVIIVLGSAIAAGRRRGRGSQAP